MTPKQLDEALPIVDHALVHVYDDEPHAAVENITTFSSIPIYALNETHNRFPKNTSVLYLSIRNISIPFGVKPEIYPTIIDLLPHIYTKTYMIESSAALVNGNRSIDSDVLEFCLRMPELQCHSVDTIDHLILLNQTWDQEEDLHKFFRKQILPYPVVDQEDDEKETFTILLRLYHQHVFILNEGKTLNNAIAPLVEEMDYMVGFSLFDDLVPFEEQFNETNISAVYVSMLTGTHKTHTGPIDVDSLRTFLTTCTETI